MIEATWSGLTVLLVLAPIALLAWLCIMWAAFYTLGVKPKSMLKDITIAEAIFFAGFAYSSAYLVGQLFSRFV